MWWSPLKAFPCDKGGGGDACCLRRALAYPSACRAVFDVVVTFESRVMEAVEEALYSRPVVEMVPCLVVNLEVKDTHDDAAVAAPQAVRLAEMVGGAVPDADRCRPADRIMHDS